MILLSDEDNAFKIELKPVVVEDEPDAHIITFSVGVQSFKLDNYYSKEEAVWMVKMLKKALEAVAKAQLKKVVVRLKRGSMATHQVTLHLSEKEWQALLKEIA